MMKRTTVTLDDNLLEQARQITGNTEISGLVNEGLRRIVRSDAVRRLIALGGSIPTAEAAPRETT